jgi:sterol desaturase/sphingolipid hydroxylase (fatty acid hydroxylase superfamily)
MIDDAGLAETELRLAAFIAVFAALGLLELIIPKRRLVARKARRWATNLAIVALDSLLVRLMANLAVPIAAVAAAVYATSAGIGLFNWLSWPDLLVTVLAILVLDFAVWAQHWLSHKIPLLWRLHQVHHADLDIDVTTAIRFHPIEIGLSMLWKIVWVLALGLPVHAVLLFEIILNGGAMFNHANIDLPRWLDGLLRSVIVTPDMHRVHHSVLRREHDSNYGFNLSIWDRLFGTYTAQPEQGHQGMTIGLESYQTQEPTKLVWSLLLPAKPFPKDP